MCGIAGIYSENQIDVGGVLTRMLGSLQHRGEDSSGIAVYGGLGLEENENYLLVEASDDVVGKVESVVGKSVSVELFGDSDTPIYSGLLKDDFDVLRSKISEINNIEGANVISAGSLFIVKDTGTVEELSKAIDEVDSVGSHGIGHVRFSTESAVDRYHAHPFQSYIERDIAVVHNGQITNYENLRSVLENNGHEFETNNDTECIVHYVSDKLKNGYTLDEALEMSIKDMDGPFSYIISTKDELGIAKDPLGLRPGVIGSKDGVYAVASEEVAIHEALGDVDVEYLRPGEYRTFGGN